MGVIVRKPPVSTKIAVAIDELSRWEKSTRQLLEGEIAVSYIDKYDPVDKKYHKTQFQLRIGRVLPDGKLSTWKDAAELYVSQLSPDLRDQIIDQVVEKAGDVFVFRRQFEEAVRELRGLSADFWRLSSEVEDHVNADVKREVLYLYKNSQISAITDN